MMLSRAAPTFFTEPGPSVPEMMDRIEGTSPASKRAAAEGLTRVLTHDAEEEMSLAAT